MWHAAEANDIATLDACCKQGDDPNGYVDDFGVEEVTPLHMASRTEGWRLLEPCYNIHGLIGPCNPERGNDVCIAAVTRH